MKRNNRQSKAAENTIDEKESPQKAKNDDNPEGVAKKNKKKCIILHGSLACIYTIPTFW
ncbi:MAG: hypothetical protein IJV28_02765 [Paludibacteraceae bacterium]|nr:hypothetical protein [Paludibacteraceae bacterium]